MWSLRGLTVARINPAVMAELDLPCRPRAWRCWRPRIWPPSVGLQPGDMIIAINGADNHQPCGCGAALAGTVPRRWQIDLHAAAVSRCGCGSGSELFGLWRWARGDRLASRWQTFCNRRIRVPAWPICRRLHPQRRGRWPTGCARKTLAEVIGQGKVLSPEGPLGAMLAAHSLSSLILWGPPGVGKTTIARLLAA